MALTYTQTEPGGRKNHYLNDQLAHSQNSTTSQINGDDVHFVPPSIIHPSSDFRIT
jgi:hypothetical protein